MKFNYCFWKMINRLVVLIGAHLFVTLLVHLQPVNSQDISRIRLSEVQVITLYRDQHTNARLSPTRPQLKCIGMNWKCHTFSPTIVQCLNRGYDGLDVQWECKANLDKSIKFGTTKVICEGYSYPEDPFILAGSCGLEYTLEMVTKSSRGGYDYYSPNNNLYETSKLSNFLTLLIMVVIILAVYKTCNKSRENEIRREINSTYAHIIEGPDFNPYTHNPSSMSAHSASLFPPPPPPYGSVVAESPGNTTTTTTATIATAQMIQNPNSNNSNNVNVPLNPNNQHLSDPNESSMPSTNTSHEQTDLKPENCVNNTTTNNNTSQANLPNLDPSTGTLRNSSSSSWGNFLASTTVGGYILNRRNEIRRSDSPPPAYEDARGENALLASNVNTTFVSSSSSSSSRR